MRHIACLLAVVVTHVLPHVYQYVACGFVTYDTWLFGGDMRPSACRLMPSHSSMAFSRFKNPFSSRLSQKSALSLRYDLGFEKSMVSMVSMVMNSSFFGIVKILGLGYH